MSESLLAKVPRELQLPAPGLPTLACWFCACFAGGTLRTLDPKHREETALCTPAWLHRAGEQVPEWGQGTRGGAAAGKEEPERFPTLTPWSGEGAVLWL